MSARYLEEEDIIALDALTVEQEIIDKFDELDTEVMYDKRKLAYLRYRNFFIWKAWFDAK